MVTESQRERIMAQVKKGEEAIRLQEETIKEAEKAGHTELVKKARAVLDKQRAYFERNKAVYGRL